MGRDLHQGRGRLQLGEKRVHAAGENLVEVPQVQDGEDGGEVVVHLDCFALVRSEYLEALDTRRQEPGSDPHLLARQTHGGDLHGMRLTWRHAAEVRDAPHERLHPQDERFDQVPAVADLFLALLLGGPHDVQAPGLHTLPQWHAAPGAPLARVGRAGRASRPTGAPPSRAAAPDPARGRRDERARQLQLAMALLPHLHQLWDLVREGPELVHERAQDAAEEHAPLFLPHDVLPHVVDGLHQIQDEADAGHLNGEGLGRVVHVAAEHVDDRAHLLQAQLHAHVVDELGEQAVGERAQGLEAGAALPDQVVLHQEGVQEGEEEVSVLGCQDVPGGNQELLADVNAVRAGD